MAIALMRVSLIGFACVAQARQVLNCETTVAVGDGRLVIELWEDIAPIGAKRVKELAESGFFTDLPFFRAIKGFLIQFGISPDAGRQAMWDSAGNIDDDPPSHIPFEDGIVSFAGYGPNSRGTHLFLTLGKQPGLGRSPWEVPVGKVVSGLDVLHGIYTGYGDQVNQGRLQPRAKGSKDYLASFPKLDSFKSCRVESAHSEL